MKRLIAAVLSLGLFSICLVGCDDKSTAKTETKSQTTVSTPEGSKTTTHDTKVEDTTKETKDKTP
jgi:phosphoenolpyruvate synthase/pyruvate phosphate dikinase